MRRSIKVDLYTDSFDQFCHLIGEQDAHILELACDPGTITRYLLSQRPDFQILGIDLAPKMIALAEQNNHNAHFIVMDAEDILSIGQTFDGIRCGICLPSLSREKALKLIVDRSKLLEEGGILTFSMMEDAYEKSGMQREGSCGFLPENAQKIDNCLEIILSKFLL
ncbi:MAG: class I SAM-dependent methyltransferase [Bacteroidota bacterium]